MADAFKNFAYSVVAVAPVPPESGGTLSVQKDHGTRFPTPPFNLVVCALNTVPTPLNAEIVRVTAIAGDVFTITRAQESTLARAFSAGFVVWAGITKKTLDDILYPAVVTKTASEALDTSTLQFIRADASAGNIVFTLPSVALVTSGTTKTIKKVDATGHTVTVTAAGAELIDDAVSQIISTQWTAMVIVSDATRWNIT